MIEDEAFELRNFRIRKLHYDANTKLLARFFFLLIDTDNKSLASN